jgi:hypothetical protein
MMSPDKRVAQTGDAKLMQFEINVLIYIDELLSITQTYLATKFMLPVLLFEYAINVRGLSGYLTILTKKAGYPSPPGNVNERGLEDDRSVCLSRRSRSIRFSTLFNS